MISPATHPRSIAPPFADLEALAGLGSWQFDAASERLTLSSGAARLFGLPAAQGTQACLRQRVLKCIAQDDRDAVRAAWKASLAGAPYDIEYRVQHDDGDVAWLWEKGQFEFDAGGHALRASGFVQDVTRHHLVRASLQEQANRDALTGLPNRRLLVEQLDLAIRVARRNGERVAVLFVDLDRFKAVNDEFGHHIGDELLRTVARRLRNSLRASDIVARIGGDEFVIVLPDIDHECDAGIVALKIVEELKNDFSLGEVVANIGASVGVTMFHGTGEDAATLLRQADAAMYLAKANGKQTLTFFESPPAQ